MKDKNRLYEPDGVNQSVSSISVVINQFHHACVSEALQNLRGSMLSASLSEVQGMTKKLFDFGGHAQQVFFAAADPSQWLVFIFHGRCYLKRNNLSLDKS
jgi:hypothetical protein